MIWRMTKRRRRRRDEWHWRFALLPVRISEEHVIWLDWYECRVVTVAEGNWAGGYRYRWEYMSPIGPWRSEEVGD